MHRAYETRDDAKEADDLFEPIGLTLFGSTIKTEQDASCDTYSEILM